MKIVHVSESISTKAGGLNITATGLADTFFKLGHDVTFISGQDDGDYSEYPFNTIFLEKTGLGKLKYLKGLKNRIEEIKPEIIIQHGIWSCFNIQISRLSKELNIAYVVVTHGMCDPYILGKGKYLKKAFFTLFQKENLQRAKFIRVLNENEREHVLRLVDSKIVVAPNGISLEDEYNCSLKREMNNICFLGRIDNKKSVNELVQAWKELESEGVLPVNSKLKIAGWTSDKIYFDKFQFEISNSYSIEYLGPVFLEDKRHLLSSCGGFILPSKGEGLPTAVLEAWRDGCIVMMTRECNFGDEVLSTCAIQTHHNVEAIKLSIKEYYELSDEQILVLQKNSSNILNRFSWSTIANKIMGQIKYEV